MIDCTPFPQQAVYLPDIKSVTRYINPADQCSAVNFSYYSNRSALPLMLLWASPNWSKFTTNWHENTKHTLGDENSVIHLSIACCFRESLIVLCPEY
nr:hypothetical protein CFP56_38730 [Quercus suber]